jgi:hypothetical protein
MSGEVHRLPDPMLRQWEAHARAVRDGMLAVGYQPAEVEHALAAIRPLYLRYARSWRPPETTDPEAYLDSLSAWVSGVFHPLMLRIAQLEIELQQGDRSERGRLAR